MAVVIGQELREGKTILIYDNGLERDAETGYIVRAADNTKITKANAGDFHRARRERKRATMVEALNELPGVQAFKEKYGELGFAAAIAESVGRKAMNSKDPKQVEAARFLFGETGLSDGAGDDPADNEQGNKPKVFLLLAELQRRNDFPKVIDADSSDV